MVVIASAITQLIGNPPSAKHLPCSTDSALHTLRNRFLFYKLGRPLGHMVIGGSIGVAAAFVAPWVLVIGAVGLYYIAHYSTPTKSSYDIITSIALGYIESECERIANELQMLAQYDTPDDPLSDEEVEFVNAVKTELESQLVAEQQKASVVRAMVQQRINTTATHTH